MPSQLFQQAKPRPAATGNSPLATPHLGGAAPLKPGDANQPQHAPPLQLPDGLTPDELNRAFQVVASAASALHPQTNASGAPHLRRSVSHARDHSGQQQQQQAHGHGQHGGGTDAEEDGHGGHDAPNWSRAKSATVLLACTVLYAIIAGATL